MIRLRSKDGTVQTLGPEVRFVEICDSEGRVGMLLYFDESGLLHQADARSPEARTYTRIFRAEFCPTTILAR